MSELLRRFRYLLSYALLAALCIGAMASGQGPRDLGVASRLILKLTLPIERMVTLPVDEAKSWGRGLAELIQVREENAELRAQIADLRKENLRFRENLISSERFRRLHSFQASQEVQMASANVMHRDISSWFQSVIIDRGTEAGIQAGMPVVTDTGVVGVISGTASDASKVLLIIDPQSRVDAYVQRSRSRGSVRGTSIRGADFEYVPRGDDVRAGDLLLTSGMDLIYPKGLVIGEVRGVEREPHGLFHRADVVPSVDMQKLEEVFVVLESRQLPPDEAFVQSGEVLWSEAAP